MTLNIIQTINNKLTADRKLIDSRVTESFAVFPAENKVLRNKLTGTITFGMLILSSEAAITNYEEIDDPRSKNDF